MSDQLSEIPSHNEEYPKAKLSSYLPENIQSSISQGCVSYVPKDNIPFTPQIGNAFNPNLALWCTNACVYAYKQFCTTDTTFFPPDTENGHPFYWLEVFHLFHNKAPCGYIAKIKPIEGDPTNRIVIAFRGTEKMSEWLDNFDYGQTKILTKPLGQTIKVHSGFWDVFTKTTTYHTVSLKDQIHELLPKYLSKTAPNELYITGHSLGAAISTLVLLNCLLRYPGLRIIEYTLGSPRVGDRALAEVLRELAKDPAYNFVVWQLVNTEDVVPTVPLPVFDKIDYSHILISNPTFPNTIGSVAFTENLGNVVSNHHPFTYYYAIKRLMSDNPSTNPVKGVDNKTGDDKKSS